MSDTQTQPPRARTAAPRRARHFALLLALAGASLAAHAQADTAQAAEAAAAEALLVQRYTIEGNTLLPPAEIDARVRPFAGRATLQRMRDAAAAVQEMYRDAGWGGVVAFLPEQVPVLGPEGAVIRIRVVEGRLRSIEVVDNRQFTRDNILESLPGLKLGHTPRVREIDAQIQLANESPAKTVQVLLQPGTEVGEISARITVSEQPVQRLHVRADNTGSGRTGRWRGALGWMHGNLWGADHVALVELQTAPEQPSAVAVLSGSYRVPLYGRNMALDAYGAWSDVDAGKTGTAAGDLQFSGRGFVLGTRATAYLPRWAGFDQRAGIGLELRDYLNACSIEGLPQGACGTAGESVSLLPLSLSYTAQMQTEWQVGLNIGLQHNLGFAGRNRTAADFEAVRAGAQRRYTALRANGTVARAFEGFGVLNLRGSAQFTRDALVPGELFGVGGANSVRGYEERELGGDKGLQLTLEYTSPNLAGGLGLSEPAAASRPGAADLRVVVFVDAGSVSNLLDAPCRPGQTRCHVAGVGAGLRLAWQQLQLRADLARALRAANTTDSGDSRLHVSAQYSF